MINRYFRCTAGKSNKFWDVCLHGNSVTVDYGRIGTKGTTHVKTFGQYDEAFAYFNRKTVEKLNKGYVEVDYMDQEMADTGGFSPVSVNAQLGYTKKKAKPVLPRRRRAVTFED